jgi:hypothetical protein
MDNIFQIEDKGKKLKFQKSNKENCLECDITKVKSWIGRDLPIRQGYLELPKRDRIEFISIVTRSQVISSLIGYDSETSMLIGKLDIIGKANYYVDIYHAQTNIRIASKFPLIEGEFSIEYAAQSGRYKIDVFEVDEDDHGFGVSDWHLISSMEQFLTNPYDLRGRKLSIRSIKKSVDSIFQMKFNCKYTIHNLRLQDMNDRTTYIGKLVVSGDRYNTNLDGEVMVTFHNLKALQMTHISFFDGYDYTGFLYDNQLHQLVMDEEKGLTRSVRYRRYELISPEDYIYIIDFID